MHSSGVRSGPGVTVHRVVRPVRMLPARNLMNTMQRMPHQASNHNLVRCMASGGGEKSWTDLAGKQWWSPYCWCRSHRNLVVLSYADCALCCGRIELTTIFLAVNNVVVNKLVVVVVIAHLIATKSCMPLALHRLSLLLLSSHHNYNIG